MFSKSKVSQAVIDAVNSVLDIKVEEKNTTQPSDATRAPMAPAQVKTLNEASEKVATPTGMRVYGSSYGNSKKAREDQVKKDIDKLKGPKEKEMKEELKGNQDKIDANKNDKIDAHDFAILRGKKKVKEGMNFAAKLLETVRKSDVPAYLRKAKGDTPLTVADVKAPKKDSISAPENLAKARNEWKEEVEQIDEVSLKTATSAYVKRVGKDETGADPKAAKTIQHIANKHGVVGVARAAKAADKEYGLNDPVHNKRKDFVKGVMSGVKEEVEQVEERHMTDAETKKKEEIVKSMKKGLAGFKARYGDKAKNVMYATATKNAMKEETLDEKLEPSVKSTDTLAGRKAGGQKDDVGPGANGKSTKVKFVPEESVEEATIAGTSGWEPMKKDVKDKSGAVHTPMSRARDLAHQAFAKVKTDQKAK